MMYSMPILVYTMYEMLYESYFHVLYILVFTHIFIYYIDLPSGEQVLAVDHEADLRGPQRPQSSRYSR